MLYQKRKIGPFTYERKWFANKGSPQDIFRFLSYRQFQGTLPPWGYLKRVFFTQLIDLTLSGEEILGGMKKNTTYEIRRAEKDGTQSKEVSDVESFRNFFNLFAPSKNLSPLEKDQLQVYGDSLWISASEWNDKPLVMHAYLVDTAVGRSRLLYSATTVETEDLDRTIMGRANRALHWYDILHFKERGFKIYDLGGVALDEGDMATQGIDQFKLGFGGETVEEDHFDSPLLVIAQKMTGKGS